MRILSACVALILAACTASPEINPTDFLGPRPGVTLEGIRKNVNGS